VIVDQIPSPNFGERKGGLMPKWVILHYTAMNSAAEAIERLCDPVHQVSAHYVISESGAVTQLVSGRYARVACGPELLAGLS
jgi:N-acetylmuramoyl-L-alanine amidase